MTITASAFEIVGGAAIVGGNGESGLDIVRLVRSGLPIGAVQFILDSGRLTLAELDQIVLPRRHLAIGIRLAVGSAVQQPHWAGKPRSA
jgi:hypothetical protein